MLDQLTREDKCIIFVLGTLGDLKDKGLVEGGALANSPAGTALYDQLKADGFEPTNDEVEWALGAIQEYCQSEVGDN